MRYLVESCFAFLLCATSVFSVSLWLSYAAFPSTTETQRARGCTEKSKAKDTLPATFSVLAENVEEGRGGG